jgi:hypothetical protein
VVPKSLLSSTQVSGSFWEEPPIFLHWLPHENVSQVETPLQQSASLRHPFFHTHMQLAPSGVSTGGAEGSLVGDSVGTAEATSDGDSVGTAEGASVGDSVEPSTGVSVGVTVGAIEGSSVGVSVGAAEGIFVGSS